MFDFDKLRSFQHHVCRKKYQLWWNKWAVTKSNDKLETFPCVFRQWGQYHYLFQIVSCTRLLALLKFDWLDFRRARSIRLFWAIPILLFFIADDRCWYFATLKPELKRQYFIAMKKRKTSNSAQTWVTKIVKNHRFVRRQPSAYGAKPGSKCYIIDRFIVTIAVWSEYCALLDAVGELRVIMNSTENLR